MAKYYDDEYAPVEHFRYGSKWVDDDNEWHGEYNEEDEAEFKPFKRKFEDIHEDATAEYEYTRDIEQEFTELHPRNVQEQVFHPQNPVKNRLIYLAGVTGYIAWVLVRVGLLIIYRR